eukprot:TRINITY_DN546_c0_g1_i1.p1 TRINITY_DN546_c0_g1~~TRINITY_DN546_c0_g1_i1.p1  ORF type:complete len:545 (-),score=158.53 TRINITY_DN546_c0_g1_i1:53-1687(-)
MWPTFANSHTRLNKTFLYFLIEMKSILLLFISVTALCWGIENVAYFPGRSGDIILSNKEKLQDESFLYLLKNEEITGEYNNEKEMEEKSIGDLIGHLIGGPILNSKADRKSFPTGNIFNKASANLLLIINGMEKSQKNQLPLLFQKSGKELNLLRSSFPQDSISTLASIATGSDPSVHGIVSEEWYSSVSKSPISAYRSGALPQSSSFVDNLSRSSSGKSLSLSASFDFQMASAFGAHQVLQSANPHFNNYAISYNEKIQSFENIFGESQDFSSISRQDIINDIANQQFGSKSSLVSRNTLSIKGKSQNAVFQLDNKENFAFFAEMTLINKMINLLTQNSRINQLTMDEIPDLFTFCVSTLKGIENVHGRQSAQYEVANEILDASLVSAIDSLNNAYKNKLSVQVVFLSNESPIDVIRQDTESQDLAFKFVEQEVDRKIFTKYFPHIFFWNKNKLNGQICQKMQENLSLQVSCPSVASVPFAGRSNNLMANETDEYDSSDAELFHTLLWFSIVLGVALFFAVYSIFTMDIGSDTLLFRATSTKR